MSKKYKGKTCVYCSTPESSGTGDHVIAREFFLPERRSNLPIVPTCQACNNVKSELEHYVTATLPFGGRHNDAAVNLKTKVPARLAKNRPLMETLREAWAEISSSSATLPIDGRKIDSLFEMIAKGLAFWHWEIFLPDTEYLVKASYLTRHGEAVFQKFWDPPSAQKVSSDLGEETFVYEGVQGTDDQGLTLWRMSLYGVMVSNDVKAPGERATTVLAIAAPRRMQAASKLVALLSN